MIEKKWNALDVEDLIAIAAHVGSGGADDGEVGDEVLLLREMLRAIAGGFESERQWVNAVTSRDMTPVIEGATSVRLDDASDSVLVAVPETDGSKR